jgi:hypothetical protein
LEIQTIKLQKNNNYTQEEIGNKIGWSRGKVNQYTTILNKIDTQVLDIARKHQKDRVSKIDTDVSYDFTEGWFRKDDYTQKEIGNKIGTQILNLAKKHQKGRVPEIGTDVPQYLSLIDIFSL